MAPYVERNTQGTLVVAGSRVSVGSVVRAFWTGETPETICQAYPALSLEQVYGAIAYYLAQGWPGILRGDIHPARCSARASNCGFDPDLRGLHGSRLGQSY